MPFEARCYDCGCGSARGCPGCCRGARSCTWNCERASCESPFCSTFGIPRNVMSPVLLSYSARSALAMETFSSSPGLGRGSPLFDNDHVPLGDGMVDAAAALSLRIRFFAARFRGGFDRRRRGRTGGRGRTSRTRRIFVEINGQRFAGQREPRVLDAHVAFEDGDPVLGREGRSLLLLYLGEGARHLGVSFGRWRREPPRWDLLRRPLAAAPGSPRPNLARQAGHGRSGSTTEQQGRKRGTHGTGLFIRVSPRLSFGTAICLRL